VAAIVLLLGLGPWPALAGSPASQPGETATACATSDFGYTVEVCLTAPSAGVPIRRDPTISATVTVANPDVTIRSVNFRVDNRNVLSDFDPPYTFTLPIKNWKDGAYTLGAVTRLSDDNVSDPAETNVLFDSGTSAVAAVEQTFEPSAGKPADPGAPFVVAAVGDGAGGSPESEAVTSLIDSWNPNLFLYLGDVYNAGTISEFENWYAPDRYFGRFKAITDPTIGNHEYTGNNGPQGYMQYWGDPPNYYSVDAAGWHIVSLDTNEKFNEVDPYSVQIQWLVDDLEQTDASCSIVFFHHPPFSVGSHGDTTELRALWRILVEHHVTLVLAGHDHNYQRWQALDGDGYPGASGTVSLVVGTGGQSEYPIQRDDDRLAVPALMQPGALRMELNPGGAALQFVTTDGVVRDSTVVPCAGSVGDSTAPTQPGDPIAIQGADGAVTLSWQPSLDNTGVVAYDIARNGTKVGTVPPAAAFVDAAAGTGASYTVTARDAAGNVSDASEPITPGEALPPSMLFADDFASGSLVRWSEVSGISVAPADSGGGGSGWLARAHSAIRPAFARVGLPDGVSDGTVSLRIDLAFRIEDQGDNPVVLCRLRSEAGESLIGISIATTGSLGLFDDIAAKGEQSATNVSRGEWHLLTVDMEGDPKAVAIAISLDGDPISDLRWTADWEAHKIDEFQLGDSRGNRVFDVHFRGVAISTASQPAATPPPAAPPSAHHPLLRAAVMIFTDRVAAGPHSPYLELWRLWESNGVIPGPRSGNAGTAWREFHCPVPP
jgi:hypothetical protein